MQTLCVQTRKLSILQSKPDAKKPKTLFLHKFNRFISDYMRKKGLKLILFSFFGEDTCSQRRA